MSLVQRPTRRAVARGVLWSLPVVSAAVAAPAYALSICPGGTIAGSIASSTRDQITLTNNGPGVIPAGTTITWEIQNVRTSSATLTLGTVSGVTLLSGTNPITLASNASTVWTFNISADIPVGGSVSWQYGINGFFYNSRVSVSECANLIKCVSDRGNVIGSTCPSTALRVAQSAQTSNYTITDPDLPPDPGTPGPKVRVKGGWRVT
ncbi:MAG TPA: hypothetical protein PKK40_04355 [Marmoricola sp.]|nr:hypothetical protein [Marmoricola sp.]